MLLITFEQFSYEESTKRESCNEWTKRKVCLIFKMRYKYVYTP